MWHRGAMDARAWDERYAGGDLVWSVGPNEAVARECSDLPPGRAVDLACGEGRNALWLASRGWQVSAVDFSAVALEKGRTLAARQAAARPSGAGEPVATGTISWDVADATTWSGADYDLAVVAYLQLAPPQRTAAIRAAYDALRPGGTFLLVAHDRTNLDEGTGGPQDPQVLISADDVLRDLDDSGRQPQVEHADRVARLVPGTADGTSEHREDAGLVAWDCLVRLTRG